MVSSSDLVAEFPSPGSAFVPPPAPDFAMSCNGNGVVSPVHTPDPAPLSLLHFLVDLLLWPLRLLQPHGPPDPLPRPLTSSRPAPPSPAASRRTSGFSRASSRPVSTASSRPTSTIHSRPVSIHVPADPAAQPSTPRPTPSTLLDPTPSDPPSATGRPAIQIRDYAFPSTDPRFSGQGPNVPRSNRPAVLLRRLLPGPSTPAGDAGPDPDDDDWEDDDGDATRRSWEGESGPVEGWARWGFGRGWFAPRTSLGSGFPSRGDLDRNFGFEDEGEEGEPEDMEIDDDDDDDDGDDHDQGAGMDEGEGEGEPLYPGLYRALYAFEPEGTAEMKLDEDQVVRVIGRGGGVGWAVVVKDGLKDAGMHALVPESYLEPVRLDGEERGGSE